MAMPTVRMRPLVLPQELMHTVKQMPRSKQMQMENPIQMAQLMLKAKWKMTSLRIQRQSAVDEEAEEEGGALLMIHIKNCGSSLTIRRNISAPTRKSEWAGQPVDQLCIR